DVVPREVLAEPDALLVAELGKLVIIGRAEGRLSMPYEIEFRHRRLPKPKGIQISGPRTIFEIYSLNDR
ncbi:hypothetical protein, partial [Klebsiella pneumoniae]|uniref:hypothetical protein n=1 Tax=Klebsiella pneumoniae TaxID=573 RepID=UPI003B98306B